MKDLIIQKTGRNQGWVFPGGKTQLKQRRPNLGSFVFSKGTKCIRLNVNFDRIVASGCDKSCLFTKISQTMLKWTRLSLEGEIHMIAKWKRSKASQCWYHVIFKYHKQWYDHDHETSKNNFVFINNTAICGTLVRARFTHCKNSNLI